MSRSQEFAIGITAIAGTKKISIFREKDINFYQFFYIYALCQSCNTEDKSSNGSDIMNILVIAIAIQHSLVKSIKKRYLETVSFVQMIGDGGLRIH